MIPLFLQERFRSYLKREPDGCLIYTGGKVADGYGWFNSGEGLPKQAHRFAYLLANNELNPDLLVCHKCDVPACCEPTHLFQGTSQENMDDMKFKGRSPNNAGINNPNCKLTDLQILEIRSLKVETNQTYAAISKLYAVSPEMISLICRRKYRNDV